MSEQTSQLVRALRRRIRATIRRIGLADLTFGLVLTLGILAALWLLSVAVEAGFWLGTEGRTVLFWALVAMATGLLLFFLIVPLLRLVGLLRRPSEDDVARRIGARYPEVSDRLVNLLHLSQGRGSQAPNALLDGAVRMLGETVQPVPFERMEDFHRARRAGRLASLPVIGLLLFLLAAPDTFLDASRRLLSPGAHFERPAPFRLVVEPGDVEVTKGEPVEVVVRAVPNASRGALPEQLTLALGRPGEEAAEALTLLPDSSGAFRHRIVGVREPLRYRAEADRAQSPWHAIDVVERPMVRGLQLALDFPNYTRLPSQRLDPGVGDVTALPGTRVEVEVGVGGPDVEAAFLRFDDGRLDTLALEGGTATGTFTLRSEGSYQILLRSARGAENNDPITHTLGLLTDAPPQVVLLDPDADAALDDALRADLRMRLGDDFGFSRLRLYYRAAERRYGEPMTEFESIDLPLESPRQLDQEIVYEWLLGESTELDPIPGDVIEYYAQVWDNDAVSGYKPAKSATQRLRFPSLAEQYRQLEAGQEGAEETLEELLRQTEAVGKEFQELRDEIRAKPEADWQDQRQLERLQERQGQMEEQVESLQQQVESMTSQMEEGSLVSEETVEMYQELQKVVEEISSPELQEALRQLQEAMENLDLGQMQEAIQNFEFNEDQYRQRLERTLELFQRLRVQQELEEAARRAEELARQQEQLAEETSGLREENGELEEEERGRGEEEENGEREEGEQEGGEQGDQEQGEQEEGEDRNQERRDQEEGREGGEQQEGQEDEQQGNQQEGQENQQSGEQQNGEQQENSGQRTKNHEQQRQSLARRQERSSEEMRELQEQIEALREQMEEVQNSPQQEMQRVQEQLEQQRLPQQMQQNAQQLQQNQLQQAQEGQQQMQQQLQQLQQQLQEMQSGMQGQQMQVNMAGLRRALDDVLRLSQQQEDVRRSVRGLASDSPQLREEARQQVELSENLSTVSDSLQSLARDIPQMSRAVQQEAGEALREMGAAVEAMSERAANRASGHQKGSMTHLNELALLLSELMDQMMNAQGSGGGQSLQQMMQQMQDLAGQQQQLNEQIQQMLNDMQGNRLSNDGQARMRQMAEQQEAIRRQLRSIARNPEARGKMLGDLNKIAEQMEETIQELQRSQADRRTVERQQQILTRLLDAQRSLQERGKEKRRESERGRDLERESPDALTPSEQAEKLRRDLIRALESGYAPDYQELIKRYFDLLQETQE